MIRLPKWTAALLVAVLALPGTSPARATIEPTVRMTVKGGAPESSVDVVFVGDGYSRQSETKFWKDIERYGKRLLDEPPFSWYRSRFNVSGAFVPSKADGCDRSGKEEKVPTFLQSHFDAPGGRFLVFEDHEALAALVRGLKNVDIVFVMVNTETFGGAGTTLHEVQVRGRALPAPTFSAQSTTSFMIAIHELGHSFAGLADEYEDVATAAIFKIPDTGDVDAANATLPRQFDRTSFETLKATVKWKHFLELPGASKFKWLHEGGYYRAKGVFRPWQQCMMLTLGEPFCPVCAEEMAKAIVKTCGDEWDDAAYHRKYPLTLFK